MILNNRKIMFNQGVLQDYVDCKRRYFLKYVKALAWPAVQVEPVVEREKNILLGQQFHRAIHQYFVNIPVDKITIGLMDPELQVWWEKFFVFWNQGFDLSKQILTNGLFPEYGYSTQLSEVRIGVKYDLVFYNVNHELIILDWKTSNYRPKRTWLANRMQTRLYQYLGVNVGKHLFPEIDFAPNQIQLIYWFAQFPDQPENMCYSENQYRADDIFFHRLIDEILGANETDFLMTDEIKYCQFCNYRSYCNRGRAAGKLDDDDTGEIIDETNLDFFDFIQVEEIPILA